MKWIEPKSDRTRTVLLAAMATVGAWFGFPNHLLHLPWLVLLLPLALFMAAEIPGSGKSVFLRGLLIGTAAHTAALYWIVIPVSFHGGIPLPLALPCPVLLGCYLGLFSGMFTLCCRWVLQSLPTWSSALAAGLIWYFTELFQNMIPVGFPWLVLPSALTFTPWAIQGAGIIGTNALSGLLAVTAVLLGQALRKPLFLIPAAAICMGLFLFGTRALESASRPESSFSVALVQGNIDQDQKWDEAFQDFTVTKYLTLTDQALEASPEVIIWPETAMPFYFQDMADQSLRIREYVRQHGFLLLTGTPGYTFTSFDPPEYVIHNRLISLAPNGSMDFYDKERLVPFGEYVPLGRFIPFIGKLTQGDLDFSPGRNAAPLIHGSARMGGLICFEAIFPSLGVERVKKGANVLVNVSNDAWFGRSSALLQHLALASLRAVETNRFLIRATNTGISAIIDNSGRILRQTSSFQDAVLVHQDVGLVEKPSIFARVSRPLPFILLALATALACWGWLRTKQAVGRHSSAG
ncbi:MAG: apolipoprotein N-acyltransferase [Deltaproteobacteria bacterium]|nr:apolipoprotein N-acyltransferase [Deltaproteobacteria bacterium]